MLQVLKQGVGVPDRAADLALVRRIGDGDALRQRRIRENAPFFLEREQVLDELRGEHLDAERGFLIGDLQLVLDLELLGDLLAAVIDDYDLKQKWIQPADLFHFSID